MGVFVALLIGGQFALFAVSGIEIVTVLFASFVFCFGIVRSLIVGTAFSLLRCFVFGFMPNVLILYLIYYNLLNYTVPIAFQGQIALYVDFDGREDSSSRCGGLRADGYLR